jgi:RNA polymerase sigma factor (TIGR02999 family)
MSGEPITVVLNRALGGDRAAHDDIYRLLYAELLKLARGQLASSDVSLNPAALVNEAYLRLLKRDSEPMRDRRAFYAYASQAMRSVLIDYVRERAADKRGAGERPITLSTGLAEGLLAATDDFSRLNDALLELQTADERCFRVVEMRYFGGMTEEDIAAQLDISLATVKRDWRKARAFLFDQLR